MTDTTKNALIKKLGLILGALVLLGGVGFGGYKFMDHRLRQGVADFAAMLQPHYTVTYDTVTTDPLGGTITLQNVVIASSDKTLLRAQQVNLSSVSSSDAALTSAQVKATALQISPYLGDVPANADQRIALSGDAQFVFSFDPASNSYGLRDFDFNAAAQHARASWQNLQFNNLVLDADKKPLAFGLNAENVVLISGDPASTTPSPRREEFSLTLQYAVTPDKLATELKDFKLAMPSINDAVSFASAKIQASDANAIPLGLSAEVRGLDLPVTVETGNAEFWQAYGYQRIKGDAAFQYNFDAASNTIPLSIQMNLSEMFTAKIQLTLSGIDLPALAKEPNNLLALQNAAVNGGEVVYTDGSLLKRMIAVNAKAVQNEPAVYVSRLQAALDQGFIPDPTKADPALVDASGKLKTYVQNLGTLTLNLQPAQPVSVGQVLVGIFLDRVKLWQLLGTTVTVS